MSLGTEPTVFCTRHCTNDRWCWTQECWNQGKITVLFRSSTDAFGTINRAPCVAETVKSSNVLTYVYIVNLWTLSLASAWNGNFTTWDKQAWFKLKSKPLRPLGHAKLREEDEHVSYKARFGFYFPVYKRLEGVVEVLKQLRRYYPEEPVYLLQDGGRLDFGTCPSCQD